VAAAEPALERIDVYVGGKLVGSALAPDWQFLWDAPPEALGAPVVAVGYAEGAVVEKTKLETQRVSFGDAIGVAVVQLFPVVTDARGGYVGSLTREDFEVLDQGTPVPIETFANEASVLSLAIVLDTSGSMADKLDLVQQASIAFVGMLDPGDEVSLYSFNFALQRVVPLTSDHSRIVNGVKTLRAFGTTALNDSIIRVLEEIGRVSGRRAVFVFSDGLDQRSIASLEQVVDAARRSETIVYAVGADDNEHSLARADLQMLADTTGGKAFFITRVHHLPAVFEAVLQDLRAQYAISYTAPPGPMGLRQVQVRVKDDSLRVRCRTTYVHRGSSFERDN